MTTIFATIGFMAMLMLVMAIGVIFRNQPLKGSCGGVGTEDCLCLAEDKPIGSCDIDDDQIEFAPQAKLTATKVESGLTQYE